MSLSSEETRNLVFAREFRYSKVDLRREDADLKRKDCLDYRHIKTFSECFGPVPCLQALCVKQKGF